MSSHSVAELADNFVHFLAPAVPDVFKNDIAK